MNDTPTTTTDWRELILLITQELQERRGQHPRGTLLAEYLKSEVEMLERSLHAEQLVRANLLLLAARWRKVADELYVTVINELGRTEAAQAYEEATRALS